MLSFLHSFPYSTSTLVAHHIRFKPIATVSIIPAIVCSVEEDHIMSNGAKVKATDNRYATILHKKILT